jgi:peptide/nickel transport system ATP-binding protein
LSAHVVVSGLRVVARSADGRRATLVRDVGFSVGKGQVLALIGESGSGKTTIALALMGYARPGCRIAGGAVQVGDTNVLSLDAAGLRQLRGRRVCYIAQSASSAFNPSKTIMDQVIESTAIHGLMPRREAEAKAVGIFRALALPDPDRIGRRYPHQVSGGQLQRLLAAMAMITDPALVIFDEPTTALDVTTQIEVLRAFKSVIRDHETTAVYVSHDLAVVAQMADQIVVLNQGEVREAGPTNAILQRPADPYTRQLLAAARPAPRDAPMARGQEPPLLEARDVIAGYGPVDRHGMPAVVVLDDVNLEIRRGETLGVIGESGSGKSTLARVLAGLLPPARGSVRLDGELLPPGLHGRTRDQFRRIQIVFQNADTALNPAHTIGRVLGRPLEFYHGLGGPRRAARVAELLERVRLPTSLATRRCADLSGGQKQRVNLARALAAEPDIILCDEVTSALDTVVAAAILELMNDLRRELGVSCLFISHDISTVRAVCDEVIVLYGGRCVESASSRNLQSPPMHPYTELLINSVPELRPGWLEATGPGRRPSPVARPSPGGGRLCVFLDRCPVRIEGTCNLESPPVVTSRGGKRILCHHRPGEGPAGGTRPAMEAG